MLSNSTYFFYSNRVFLFNLFHLCSFIPIVFSYLSNFFFARSSQSCFPIHPIFLYSSSQLYFPFLPISSMLFIPFILLSYTFLFLRTLFHTTYFVLSRPHSPMVFHPYYTFLFILFPLMFFHTNHVFHFILTFLLRCFIPIILSFSSYFFYALSYQLCFPLHSISSTIPLPIEFSLSSFLLFHLDHVFFILSQVTSN